MSSTSSFAAVCAEVPDCLLESKRNISWADEKEEELEKLAAARGIEAAAAKESAASSTMAKAVLDTVEAVSESETEGKESAATDAFSEAVHASATDVTAKAEDLHKVSSLKGTVASVPSKSSTTSTEAVLDKFMPAVSAVPDSWDKYIATVPTIAGHAFEVARDKVFDDEAEAQARFAAGLPSLDDGIVTAADLRRIHEEAEMARRSEMPFSSMSISETSTGISQNLEEFQARESKDKETELPEVPSSTLLDEPSISPESKSSSETSMEKLNGADDITGEVGAVTHAVGGRQKKRSKAQRNAAKKRSAAAVTTTVPEEELDFKIADVVAVASDAADTDSDPSGYVNRRVNCEDAKFCASAEGAEMEADSVEVQAIRNASVVDGKAEKGVELSVEDVLSAHSILLSHQNRQGKKAKKNKAPRITLQRKAWRSVGAVAPPGALNAFQKRKTFGATTCMRDRLAALRTGIPVGGVTLPWMWVVILVLVGMSIAGSILFV